MTCKQIYARALALLGEDVKGGLNFDYYDPFDPDSPPPEEVSSINSYTIDYSERALYLLRLVFTELSQYEYAINQFSEYEFEGLTFDSQLPLGSMFTLPAIYRLASLLILGEDRERSDYYYKLCKEQLDLVLKSATSVESIKEVY